MSVRKLPNGKYKAVVYVGKDPRTGKRKRMTKTCDTRKEAKEAEAELIKNYKGKIRLGRDITFEELLEKWKLHKKSQVSPTTFDRWQSHINNHILPYFGKLKITDLENAPYYIQEYIDEKRLRGRLDGKGGLAEQTILHHYNIIYNALNYAITLGYIVNNPCDNPNLDKPTQDNEPGKAFTIEQALDVLELFKGHILYPIVHLAMFAGLRRGELVGLRICDIDFKNNIIHVRNNIVKTKEGLIEKEPKTNSSVRDVVVDDITAEMLKEHIKNKMKNVKYIKDEYLDSELIFTKEDGSPIHPDYITKTYLKILRRNGYKGYRFHDLRHTNASILYEAGARIKEIQERHGHASSKTTSDTYTHLKENIQHETAKKLSGLIKNVQE